MATTNKKTAAKKTAAKKGTASRNNTKKKTTKKTEEKNYVPVYIISMIIITILIAVIMYVDYGEGGILNNAIKNFFCGLFGICGYFVPVLAAGMTAYMIKEKNIHSFWIKLLQSFLALINVSALINLFTPATSYSASEAFMFGYTSVIGGGFFGALISIFLENMVQKIASCIILIITLIILTRFITNVSIVQFAAEHIKSWMADAQDKFDEVREERAVRKAERTAEREAEFKEQVKAENDSIFGASLSLGNDDGGTKAKKEPVKENIPAEDLFSNDIDKIFGKTEYPVPDAKKEKKTENMIPDASFDSEDDTEQPAGEKAKERADSMTVTEKEQYNDEFNKAIEQPKVEYVPPTSDLLDKPHIKVTDKRDEMRRTAERLITVLDDFGVKAKLVQVTQGPTVTRYEIQLETGTKLAKIVNLSSDIALNLAVETVLVAPVPGKPAVGIEIPNKTVSVVSIYEMLESDEFKRAKSKLTIALGKDIGGKVVIGNIEKMPHVLIAGATNSGKSVCINTIIMSLLYKSTPDEVRLIMIDPKEVELSVYNGIPHLLVPVVSDPKKAAGSLNWAVTEMERRYKLLAEENVRNIDGYNKLMERNGTDKLPQIVIIIDELADLMMVAAKEVETYICRIAQKARAAGIHLILATQRPSADVITGLIRTNVPSRIAFAVGTQIDSRIILDSGGAEKLLGRGDMLYHPIGAKSLTRVQGALVSDDEVERVVSFIKEHSGETHYSEDLAEEIERHAIGENGVTPDIEEDGDPLLREAIELAMDLGKISTSMIQRRLGVGYARAGRIVDQMEQRGIISGANGAKPRELLMSRADLDFGNDDTEDAEETDYEE